MRMSDDTEEEVFDRKMRRALLSFSNYLDRNLGGNRDRIPCDLRDFRGFLWGSKQGGNRCAKVTQVLKAISALEKADFLLPEGTELKELTQRLQELYVDVDKYERMLDVSTSHTKSGVSEWIAMAPKKTALAWDGTGSSQVLVLVSPAIPFTDAARLIKSLLGSKLYTETLAERAESEGAVLLTLPSARAAWSSTSALHRVVACRKCDDENSTSHWLRRRSLENSKRTRRRSSRSP